MPVLAEKAISFTCESCRKKQYADFTLETKDMISLVDNIYCKYCGCTNTVYMPVSYLSRIKPSKARKD